MLNGINSSASSSIANTQTAAIQSTAASQSAAQTTPAPAAADSVKLSATAQAHAMQQQGMAVKTIAANMGITTQDVDSYLGISGTTSGGGGGGTGTLQAIAAKVRVNGPQSSSQS